MSVPIVAPASTWTRGRRKSDGHPFWFIPGSKPGLVYMADSAACTCPSAQHSKTGGCKHTRAVADFERGQRQVAGAEHAATASPTSWRPCSRECGELLSPEHHGKMCDACWERITRGPVKEAWL